MLHFCLGQDVPDVEIYRCVVGEINTIFVRRRSWSDAFSGVVPRIELFAQSDGNEVFQI
jgi:hypothetical protein